MLIVQTSKISGRVLDAKTLGPLPFANVFINNTTIGTTTDENGFFKLNNVPVGRNEVISNPSIKTAATGTTQFSFYTSEIIGSYRVVVEGVTGNGEAVRSVGFLEVRE